MKLNVLNRICARATVISCALGAFSVDAALLVLMSNQVSLSDITSDWLATIYLGLGLIPAGLLGFIFGMIFFYPWVRPICSRLNGAPFKPGELVMVLTGPLKGRTAKVKEITVGQGGWNLVLLDLAPEIVKQFGEIFEEYSLIRVSRDEQCSTRANRQCQ